MNSTALALTRDEIMERVLTVGDLSKLTPRERSQYYLAVCESVGLNPLTRPLEYLTLQGKTVLYSRKEATDQLRGIHRVSLRLVGREMQSDVLMVTARATMPDGREDESTGAVSMKGLTGESLANATMKAETKAKRRVTLSIVGLSGIDESEIDSIPNARPAGYGEDSYPTAAEVKALPVATVAAPPPATPSPKPESERRPVQSTPAPVATRTPMDVHLDDIKLRISEAQGQIDLDVCLANLKASSVPKDHPRRVEMFEALKAAEQRIANMREPGSDG